MDSRNNTLMVTGESRFKLETCLGQCAGAAAQCSQGSQLAPGGERQGESNNGRRRAAERQRRKMSPHLKHTVAVCLIIEPSHTDTVFSDYTLELYVHSTYKRSAFRVDLLQQIQGSHCAYRVQKRPPAHAAPRVMARRKLAGVTNDKRVPTFPLKLAQKHFYLFYILIHIPYIKVMPDLLKVSYFLHKHQMKATKNSQSYTVGTHGCV